MILTRVQRWIGGAVLLLLVVFGCDAWRAAHNPTRSVTIMVMWQMPLKGGKIEYDYDHSETEVCVAAWLPHGGHAPCWYLTRHRMRTICCQ